MRVTIPPLAHTASWRGAELSIGRISPYPTFT
jgi:hypothetical protein